MLTVSGEAIAQVTPARDGTATQVQQQGDRFVIRGGQRSADGANLFHSFEAFGLDAGQLADFRANTHIQNVLGRVVGGDASVINGLLRVSGSDANLWLMNPAGIVFGDNARLDINGSFTATTASGIELSDRWWWVTESANYATLVGDPTAFAFPGAGGSILNAGQLTVAPGEHLMLAGGVVINTGELSAPGGQLSVVAVPEDQIVRLGQEGQLLSLELTAIADSQNAPTPTPITPLALPELLTDVGIQHATGVTVTPDGTVQLVGSGLAIPDEPGTAIASGTLSTAASDGVNSEIAVLGDRIGVMEAAIDASGQTGGGTIRIGGDYQGVGSVFTSDRVVIDGSSAIRSDALTNGDGGRIIIWSDGHTTFAGQISAQGGERSGDGGFVEVSGLQTLAFSGQVNTLAPNGTAGTLLLDPTNILVQSIGLGVPGEFATLDQVDETTDLDRVTVGPPPGDYSIVTPATLAAATTNIVLQATDGIFFNEAVTIPTNGVGLRAEAGGDINIDAPLSTTNGAIALIAGGNIEVDDVLNSNGGLITLQAGALLNLTSPITTLGGSVTAASTTELNVFDTVTTNGGDISFSAGDDLDIGADITSNGGLIELTADGNTDGIGTLTIDDTVLDAGTSDILLTGYEIDLVGVTVARGQGSFIVQPSLANQDISLNDAAELFDPVLRFTADELGRLEPNFSELIVGRADGTGAITLGNADLALAFGLTLRSPAAGGSITTLFDITADGPVNLIASEDINTQSITTSRDVLNIISTNGTITINGDIDTANGTVRGADVTIQGANGIQTTNIFTNGAAIDLSSTNGDIDTSLGTLNSLATVGNGGAIALDAPQGNITTGDLIFGTNDGTANPQELTVDANGTVDLTGLLDANGAAIRVGTITPPTLLNVSNTINGSGDIEFMIDGDFALADADITTADNADISIQAAGNLELTGTGQVNTNGGDLLFESDRTLDLATDISIDTQGTTADGNVNVSATDALTTGAIASGRGNMTFDGNTVDTTNGDLETTTGDINITGDTTVTLGDVTTIDGDLTIAGDTVNTVAGTIEAETGNITISGNATLGDITTTESNLTIRGSTITTSGDITTETGDIDIVGNSVVTVGNISSTTGTISASGRIINGTAGAIQSNQGAITFEARDGLIVSDVATTTGDITLTSERGDITTTGNIETRRGAIAITGNDTVTLNDLTTTTGNVTVNGNTVDTTDGTIQTETGAIAITGSDDVQLGDLNSSGGDIEVTSEQGSMITQSIDASAPNGGGAIILSAQDAIRVNDTIRTNRNAIQLFLGSTLRLNDADIDTNGGEFSIDNDGVLRIVGTGAIATGGNDLQLAATGITIADTIELSTTGNRASGNLSLTATQGSLNTGNLNTSGQRGGDVVIRARRDVNVGDIDTSGTLSGGNITVISETTSITTGDLLTEGNTGGDVELQAIDRITTDSVTTRGTLGDGGDVFIDPINVVMAWIDAQGGDRGTGGDVDITVSEFARFTGSFRDRTGQDTSISTAGGINGGNITIRHGGNGEIPFIVGNADTNGSAVLNSDTFTIDSGRFFFTYQEGAGQGRIRIVSVPPPDVIVEPPIINPSPNDDPRLTAPPDEQPITPLTVDEVPELALDTINDLETFFTQQYTSYSDAIPEPPIASLEEIQRELRLIEDRVGIRPAILYVVFTPPTVTSSQLTELERSGGISSDPSRDRLELVLVTPDGQPDRVLLPEADRETVMDVARQFYLFVTDPNLTNTSFYRTSAQQFYDWMIDPIRESLDNQAIEHLSFVLDGGLRSLPMAALLNGDRFLIEDFTLGLMPSLSLTDTRYANLADVDILAMGASEFEQNTPLPAVPIELSAISDEPFLNSEFTLSNLQDQRQQNPFGIVHLATHGEFRSGGPDNSYIQLWNDRLFLDNLRALNLNDPQVELMVLSACRTALGDANAELGFAGLAVQAGVKSALASLWYVSDVGTLALMTEFYDQIDETVIRADAVRQAQLTMLRGDVRLEDGVLITPDRRYQLPEIYQFQGEQLLSHPYFWSAFTIVGSPW
jgi:filamentous hemagglutinin family protein